MTDDVRQHLHAAHTSARCALIEWRAANDLPLHDAIRRLEAVSVALRSTREAYDRALASLPADVA